MAVSVPHESHGPGAEDLYRDVFPSLLAYVRSRGQMRRFEAPEDVCQEVILQVWHRRRAGTEVRSALGFARKLAHDRSVDVRRRPELEIVDLRWAANRLRHFVTVRADTPSSAAISRFVN